MSNISQRINHLFFALSSICNKNNGVHYVQSQNDYEPATDNNAV